MQKNITFIISIILFFILVFLFIRLVNPREIDDVSPEIICKKECLEKSKILWVIPEFNNKSISENKEWCDYILSLNKTLGLHGIRHEPKEFEISRNQEYLQQGINSFKECFGFSPDLFKPPQLKISKDNLKLIKENKMTVKSNLNQMIHKVYHCGDDGIFSNWIIDLF